MTKTKWFWGLALGTVLRARRESGAGRPLLFRWIVWELGLVRRLLRLAGIQRRLVWLLRFLGGFVRLIGGTSPPSSPPFPRLVWFLWFQWRVFGIAWFDGELGRFVRFSREQRNRYDQLSTDRTDTGRRRRSRSSDAFCSQ